MKTTKLLLLAAIGIPGLTGAQIDLVPGMNYSYNPPNAQNVITSISVDACNNDAGNAAAFDVSMYLYDQSTSNYWIIGTTRLNNGLSGNACINIYNWDIDIDDTPNIPAGTYRLGVWVDSGSEIPETDENNNAGLLSGNISYNPSSSGLVDYIAAGSSGISSVYPTPARDKAFVKFGLQGGSEVTLSVYDVTGKQVMLLEDGFLAKGTYTYDLSTAGLETGVYFIRLAAGESIHSAKFTVFR